MTGGLEEMGASGRLEPLLTLPLSRIEGSEARLVAALTVAFLAASRYVRDGTSAQRNTRVVTNVLTTNFCYRKWSEG